MSAFHAHPNVWRCCFIASDQIRHSGAAQDLAVFWEFIRCGITSPEKGMSVIITNNITRASMSNKATTIEVVIPVGVCSIGLAFLEVGEKLIIHQTQWPKFSVVIFGFRFTAVPLGRAVIIRSPFLSLSLSPLISLSLGICLSVCRPAPVCICAFVRFCLSVFLSSCLSRLLYLLFSSFFHSSLKNNKKQQQLLSYFFVIFCCLYSFLHLVGCLGSVFFPLFFLPPPPRFNGFSCLPFCVCLLFIVW